jgi:hypothetical protein
MVDAPSSIKEIEPASFLPGKILEGIALPKIPRLRIECVLVTIPSCGDAKQRKRLATTCEEG